VRSEMIGRIDGLVRRALSCWARRHEGRRTELRAAMRALPSGDTLLALPRQRLDGAAGRLPRALIANARVHHTAYSRIAGRLAARLVTSRLARERDRLASLAMRAAHGVRVQGERRRDYFAAVSGRLTAALRANAEARRGHIARAGERLAALVTRAAIAMDTLLDRRDAQLERMAQLLTAFSYHGVLARGFALVRSDAGKPLRSAAAVSPGTRVDIEFADGRVRAMAEVRDMTAEPAARRVPRRRRRREPDPRQGTLF
jgi:exodeoxyribonuclease VII large subunit